MAVSPLPSFLDTMNEDMMTGVGKEENKTLTRNLSTLCQRFELTVPIVVKLSSEEAILKHTAMELKHDLTTGRQPYSVTYDFFDHISRHINQYQYFQCCRILSEMGYTFLVKNYMIPDSKKGDEEYIAKAGIAATIPSSSLDSITRGESRIEDEDLNVDQADLQQLEGSFNVWPINWRDVLFLWFICGSLHFFAIGIIVFAIQIDRRDWIKSNEKFELFREKLSKDEQKQCDDYATHERYKLQKEWEYHETKMFLILIMAQFISVGLISLIWHLHKILTFILNISILLLSFFLLSILDQLHQQIVTILSKDLMAFEEYRELCYAIITESLKLQNLDWRSSYWTFMWDCLLCAFLAYPLHILWKVRKELWIQLYQVWSSVKLPLLDKLKRS